MKKYIVIIILFFFAAQSNLHAQKFDVQEGTIQKTKSEPLKIIGLYQGNLISISKRNEDLYLVKYDKETLKPKQYVNLPLSYKEKKVDFIDVIKINNRYLLITRFNNKKKNESYYLSQEIDMESLKVQGKPELWSTCYFPESYEQNGFFVVQQSTNRSETIIINSLNNTPKNNGQFQLRIYAQDSLPYFQKNISIAHNLLLFDLIDVAEDTMGIVYLLGKKYFKAHQDVLNGEINYKYIIYRYDTNNEKLSEIPFKHKERIIIQMQMALNKGKIICSGISFDYSNKHRVNAETYLFDSTGHYLMLKSQRNINVYKPSGALLKENSNTIPTFVSQKLIPQPKDRLMFIAEQRNITSVYSIPVQYTILYLQSIAILIDSNGIIEENFEVNKQQNMKGKKYTFASMDEYYDPIYGGSFSHIFFTANNHFYLAYNEYSKNITKKTHRFYQGEEDKVYPLICLLEQGEANKCYLLNSEENDPNLKLYTNAYYYAENKLYVIAKKEGGQLVLKITFRGGKD
jgi:hypothetical protein